MILDVVVFHVRADILFDLLIVLRIKLERALHKKTAVYQPLLHSVVRLTVKFQGVLSIWHKGLAQHEVKLT